MIAQCKGKDISKVPASQLKDTGWITSIKYDGNYVQIHKTGNVVKFFTSGNKEFYHELAADELIKNHVGKDFVLEAEYIADSEGMLGDRRHAAKLTTYRTNFTKGIANIGLGTSKDKFMVFDVIMLNTSFLERINWLVDNIKGSSNIRIVTFGYHDTLDRITAQAKAVVNEGYEGIVAKHRKALYEPGKRINSCIKVKYRPTADLKCINLVEGEGKYLGMIGALVLVDSKARLVNVGSGLSDEERKLPRETYLGKIIEIGYEQILDTYIQPTFISIREDKNESD